MAYRLGLLGKKVGMTQTFTDKGVWLSLSVVETGPCVVLDVMTPERNGYAAVRFGFDDKTERRTNKPLLGQFVKAGTTPKRFIREIRLAPEEAAKFSPGQLVSIGEIFRRGDLVDATSVSKGKGFQGVIKRYHFSGFRATHGTHEYFRHGGSIGCRLTPGRVFRGQRMPGQMGNRKVTVQNLRVYDVDEERNLLLLQGSVPGAPDTYVVLRRAAKQPPRPFVARQPAAPEPPAPPPIPEEPEQAAP